MAASFSRNSLGVSSAFVRADPALWVKATSRTSGILFQQVWLCLHNGDAFHGSPGALLRRVCDCLASSSEGGSDTFYTAGTIGSYSSYEYQAAPTVVNVTSAAANGSYALDATIDITGEFSDNVYITGTPQLTLQTGAVDQIADYIGGADGSTTMAFRYTVSDCDSNSDLDYVGTDSLTLNAGTILTNNNVPVSLTLPTPGAAHSLGHNKALNVQGGNSACVNGTTTTTTTTLPAPTVTSIAAVSGTTAGGTSVTITGTGFVTGVTVTLGGTSCTSVVLVSATSITCTTPSGTAGAQNVVATNTDTKTGTLSLGYTYVTWSQEAYLKASNAEANDQYGRSVSLSGDTLVVGAYLEYSNQTTITNGTTSSANNSAADSGAAYVYRRTQATGTPSISSLSPNSGAPAGDNIIIFGGNFYSGAVASVGGVNCTTTTVQGPNEIICTLPTKPTTGALTVTVTNSDATTGSLTSAYTYP